MPQLSDLVGKRKFVKKEYRPWDLSGTGTVDGKEKLDESVEPEVTPVIAKPAETVKSETVAMVKVIIPEERPTMIKQPSMQMAVSRTEKGNETGNNSDNKQVTNKKQLDNIKVTQSKQRDNIRVTIREHTSNTLDNIIGNTEGFAFLIDSIKKLAGIQKSIFLYVIHVCSARGVLDTGNILSADLANVANCSIGSAKTSLIRLIEKQLILRLQGKASRGGHMVLGITKELQSAAIQAQQALFNPLKMSHTGNTTGNITNNISSYSSSNIINTTTLPGDWEQIDMSSLFSIGFSKTQLLQLFEKQFNNPEAIQESINHFAFGLEHNPKVKSYPDPLNVFMGVLRKGGAWIEKNYISPKEKAMADLLELKRREAVRMQELEKMLIEEEFKIWLTRLDSVEREKILKYAAPKSNMLSKAVSDQVDEGNLLQHFKANVYAKRQV